MGREGLLRGGYPKSQDARELRRELGAELGATSLDKLIFFRSTSAPRRAHFSPCQVPKGRLLWGSRAF